MDKTYEVRWTIDLDAENPLEAVKLAKEIQLDPDSIANYFEIINNGKVICAIDLDD